MTNHIELMDKIEVKVTTEYLPEHSDPSVDFYVFSYTITMQNHCEYSAKLLTRHWLVTDANGDVQELLGTGFPGEAPHLKPGEVFQFTSGMILKTPVGSVQGIYHLITDEGILFFADVAPFTFARPRYLH